MPGEFEEHLATLLLWPERRDIWRDGARPAQRSLRDLAIIISRYEPVIVGVTSSQFMNARHMLPKEIPVVEVSYDDAWIRDTAPAFITNGDSLKGINWRFNSWGGVEEGSYFPWMLDDLLSRKIAEWFRMPLIDAPFVIEGGGIHVDGEGTLIACKDCLLNPNRNPGVSENAIEAYFHDALGIDKVIWINRGLYLEENNGHIDNMCAFVRPGTVLLAWCNDENDPQYEISKDAYEVLKNETDAKGRPMEVIKMPLPPNIYITKEEEEGIETSLYALPRLKGDKVPASYINYYFINGGVIVPQFNCAQDKEVLDIFLKVFPDRDVIGFNPHEFLLGGGGVHCMTMQVPLCKKVESFLPISGMSQVRSLVSPKVEVRKSSIDGSGMFAKEDISKGEIVYIKGGHILRKEEVFSSGVINSYLPIGEDYFIAAQNSAEEINVKLYNNHSCDPNCGMQGDITFVAIKDIKAQEELTIDYAMIDDDDYSFACNCGSINCRKIVTGKDWKLLNVQEKYLEYFAPYLRAKIV